MTSGSIPALVRRRVVERASGLCEYCRSPQRLSPITFELDHVVPRSSGGATDFDNLCLACGTCNGAKHARTRARDPKSRRLVGLFNPRRQRWDRHFSWFADFSLIKGKTATGRATVLALDMNNERIVKLRQLWRKMAVFPQND